MCSSSGEVGEEEVMVISGCGLGPDKNGFIPDPKTAPKWLHFFQFKKFWIHENVALNDANRCAKSFFFKLIIADDTKKIGLSIVHLKNNIIWILFLFLSVRKLNYSNVLRFLYSIVLHSRIEEDVIH